METKNFRTRTLIKMKSNPSRRNDVWPLALDMGYSAVKIMSKNFIGCFPAYARKMPKNAMSVTVPGPNDILYRDKETGDVYAVGSKAESMISIESTNDSTAVLYGRNRFYSEIFRVTSRVGLALGLMSNEFGSPAGKEIKIQTGLPPKYIVDDSVHLKQALTGDYDFDIKIGENDWMNFKFTIKPGNVFVTQQPMGSMISVATDKNGRPTPDAERLYNSNMLVFDPGFRTGDCCLIKKGSIDLADCETFDDLSMITVLERTSEEIRRQHGVSIAVPAMQSYLECGFIKSFDRAKMASKREDFAPILEEANRRVCENAIEKLCEVYNYFQEIDYLVITGGTGAAWGNMIRTRLKDLETLTILSGNRNEDLPHIFSNVRGYYMYLINRM